MKIITVNKTVSKGIVIGKIFVLKKADLIPASYEITLKDTKEEIRRFNQALDTVRHQLMKLAEASDIFAGHLMIAGDAMLADSVTDKINGLMNAEQALKITIDELTVIFESMTDEYMRERSVDVKDVGERIMRILKGEEANALTQIHEKVIVVAEDLAPSDTAAMDFKYVIGFITERGGVTSHVSIIAKNNEIPALMGAAGILSEVQSGELLIMDASAGQIILDPDEDTLAHYELLREEHLLKQKRLTESRNLPGITPDGRRVEIYANAGSIEEVKQAVTQYTDGIGLFRSELIYMEKTHFPTEEEQFIVYKEAAEACPGEIIIRTLDIGGDKDLPYYQLDKEENPFLGWRGIRISLELKDVFKAQLRAILKASHYGKLKIMFPMIISLEELIQGKELVEQCKQELLNEKIPFDDRIEIGIMIETPAAVINIDDLAQQADFFSIGTNDLTQYLLAVDRGNNKISKLYNAFHPAVLRSIQKVIETGQRYHRKVSLCGEFAGDPKAVRLLLGMGLKKFSMSANSVAEAKDIIRSTSYKAATELAERVLAAKTVLEVMNIIESK